MSAAVTVESDWSKTLCNNTTASLLVDLQLSLAGAGMAGSTWQAGLTPAARSRVLWLVGV